MGKKFLFLVSFLLLVSFAFAETTGNLGIKGNDWTGLIGAGLGLAIIIVGIFLYYFFKSEGQ
jgi:hypothetical protein